MRRNIYFLIFAFCFSSDSIVIMNKVLIGHFCALFSMIVWGTTYAIIKRLLDFFTPAEILVIRFTFAFLFLMVLTHTHIRHGMKEELSYFLAGVLGSSLYYSLESYSLHYTFSSNVAIIIAIAPLFSAFFNKKKIQSTYVLGAIVSLAGVALITFNGTVILGSNPKGDILALTAAFCWALFSQVLSHIGIYKRPNLYVTMKTFFYGMITMIPLSFLDPEFGYTTSQFTMANIISLIFLTLIASALCYLTWNYAVLTIGNTASIVYIYISPIVSLITGYFLLSEKITLMSIIGTLLVFAGLATSAKRPKPHKKESSYVKK